MAKIQELTPTSNPPDSAVVVVTTATGSFKITVEDLRALLVPPATTAKMGGVIVGSGLRVDELGFLSADNNLRAATTTTLGGIKIGQGLDIDRNGVLSTAPSRSSPIREQDATITNNYTIRPNSNASSIGPITIGKGVTVEIPRDSTWVIF
jgi:hypothetical protein